MGALKDVYAEVKLLVESGQLYAAREKLKAIGFSPQEAEVQLQAVRDLIQTQRFTRRRVQVQPLQ